MFRSERHGIKGSRKFFRLALSHDNLYNTIHTNFGLIQHHKYSLTELENMIPWEREVYVKLLTNHLEEEEKRQKAQEAKMRN